MQRMVWHFDCHDADDLAKPGMPWNRRLELLSLRAGAADRVGVVAAGLECPCCGDVGAVPDEDGCYHDGQELVCGCPGQVSMCSETPPFVASGQDWCPVCDGGRGETCAKEDEYHHEPTATELAAHEDQHE